MPETTSHLDWSKSGSAGDPAPCSICGKSAICRSPKGTAVHKTCAETWVAAHASRADVGRAA